MTRVLRRLGAVVALTAVLVVVDGLVARPEVQVATANAPFVLQAFLRTTPTEVSFVYIGRAGGTITGTITTTVLAGGGTAPTRTGSAAFRGTLDGTSVAVTVAGSSGPDREWTGTLAGGRLQLRYPAAGGGTRTLVFERSSVTAYNRAVATLQGRATEAAAAR